MERKRAEQEEAGKHKNSNRIVHLEQRKKKEREDMKND